MSTRTTKTSLELGRITMQKIKHRKLLKSKTLKSKRLKLFVQHLKKWANYSVEKQRSKHMYGSHSSYKRNNDAKAYIKKLQKTA